MTKADDTALNGGYGGIVAALCFAVLPLTATLVEKGVVIVFAVLGIAGLVRAVRDGKVAALVPKVALLVALPALAWIVYRSIDTFDGAPTVSGAVRIAGLVFCAFCAVALVRALSAGARMRTLDLLSLGAAVSLAVIAGGWAVETAGIEGIIVTNRSDVLSIFSSGLVCMVALAPAVVTHLVRRGRGPLAWLFAVALGALCVATGSNAAALAFAVVALAAAAIRLFPGWMPRAVTVACIAGTLALPGAIAGVMALTDEGTTPDFEESRLSDPDGVAGSFGHRYYIWRFATDRALERPFAGWGYDSSRSIPGGHETFAIGKEMMPLHPHNGVLQLWLELGIPGLLIAAGILWLLFRHPFGGAGERYVKPLTLLAIIVSSSATYGLWQSWWFSAISMLIVAMFLFEEKSA